MSRQKGQTKVKKVMHEYRLGMLRSSSGQQVTSRKQALAIALSEAGLSKKKGKGKSKGKSKGKNKGKA